MVRKQTKNNSTAKKASTSTSTKRPKPSKKAPTRTSKRKRQTESSEGSDDDVEDDKAESDDEEAEDEDEDAEPLRKRKKKDTAAQENTCNNVEFEEGTSNVSLQSIPLEIAGTKTNVNRYFTQSIILIFQTRSMSSKTLLIFHFYFPTL